MGFYLVATSALLPFSYVGLLHLADRNGTDRNNPNSVKRRCLGAVTCCAISVGLTYNILKYMRVEAPLSFMGFRWSGIVNAIVYPTILVNLLYAGQWLLLYHDGYFKTFFSLKQWVLSFKDVCWIRDAILAPLTEEITFRACSTALLAQYFGFTTTILVAPLFFSLSHLHHIGDDGRRGYTLKEALLRRSFQCLYTYVFGLYSSYLFLSTRHVVAPIITHAFCNSLGLPLFSEIDTFPKKSTRIALWSIFVLGMFGFVGGLRPLTNSNLYL